MRENKLKPQLFSFSYKKKSLVNDDGFFRPFCFRGVSLATVLVIVIATMVDFLKLKETALRKKDLEFHDNNNKTINSGINGCKKKGMDLPSDNGKKTSNNGKHN